jgi:hypothetical protein
MPKPKFAKFILVIEINDAISKAYFLNSSLQFMCLYAFPPILAPERLSKTVMTATNMRERNRNIFSCAVTKVFVW